MENVGYAALQVIPSFKGIDKQLEQGTSKGMLAAGTKGGAQFGESAGKSAGRRFGGIFTTAAKASLVGLAGAGALAFKLGADSVKLASDLNESLNAVNVTYDEQAKAVKKLGKDAADSLGLSRAEFNGLAVQFSAFATQVAGGEGPKVVGVLEDLTTRGADFASVMNLEVNEAMGLFQSGLAGETEPLRKFGIDLSAAAVQAHAYKTGIAEAGEELTEGEKVQARYSLLMKQTAKTQGDFANTSDSLANRQRILNARWDDARAKLGKALLPILEDATGLILEKGIPAFERFSRWFTKEGVPGAQDFANELKPAAAAVKDLIGFLNDLPSDAKLTALAGAFSVGAALKLRGGGGGALGTAGRALGISKPVPVFVTNPGFGVGGGIGGGKGGKTPGVVGALPGLPVPVGLGSAPGNPALFDPFGLNPPKPPKGSQNVTIDGQNVEMRIFPKLEREDVRAQVEEAKKILAATPTKVQTAFEAEGIPQTKKDVLDLVDKYDLTKADRKTIFRALRLPETQGAIKEYLGILAGVPQSKATAISVPGASSALQTVQALSSAISALPGLGGVGAAISAGAAASDRGSGREAPRRAPRSGDGVYRDLERFVDDRYHANKRLGG